MDGKRMIYFDNAATTKILPEVVEAMLPYFSECYGNASSMYDLGQESKKAVEHSRKVIADMINANSKDIYFTSGGTEANNWIIKESYSLPKRNSCLYQHIITSKIEHPAILEACHSIDMERFFTDITYLDVDKNGLVNPGDVRNAITEETVLISIMYANNEIGTIQNIEEIGEIAHENQIFFHVDAVQAFGHIPIDVKKCHINALSASGHKFNGPKGIGFLYCDSKFYPFMNGGHQERGLRAGTENVSGIVGMGKAAEIARSRMFGDIPYIESLRNHLIHRVLTEIPDTKLNGCLVGRLPNNANFTIKGCEGESMLIMLNMNGICASSGSACATGLETPSHVLKAIGLTDEEAHSTLRFSLSYENTREEIDYTVDCLKDIVKKLRDK